MKLRLVKLTARYQRHLTEMMDEWCAAGEKIVPWAIRKNDYHDFERYMEQLDNEKQDEKHVPESTFFCLDEERDIFVGAVNIRHYLNDELLAGGGHIGDGVRPSERRKGIATRMIELALEECRKLGIGKVLMCCDRENTGSAKSIQNNGGVLENEVEADGRTVQRYWIDLKLLFVADEKNYTEDMPVVEACSTRGIICRDGKYAMQLGGDGEYKIPGGGLEDGESYMEALCREVAEETGLVVDEEKVRFLGETVEIRRDIREADKKYVKRSLVYLCDVKEERVEIKMTESEIKRGYHPVWADLDTILSQNHRMIKEDWQLRDTRILELLRERGVLR